MRASARRASIPVAAAAFILLAACHSSSSDSSVTATTIEDQRDFPRIVVQRIGLDAGFANRHISTHRLTGHPCASGNYAIWGYRTTHTAPFRRLGELRKGDDVKIVVSPSVSCVYKLTRDAYSVDAGDIRVIANTPFVATLTVTTDIPRHNDRRLVVTAELTEGSSNSPDPSESN